MDIDDDEGLEPYTLGGLHGEEVQGPERILRCRTHPVEADFLERLRREAVLGQDLHDRRLAHADTHAPQLFSDPTLAPGGVLALQRHDERDHALMDGRATAPIWTTLQRPKSGRPRLHRCLNEPEKSAATGQVAGTTGQPAGSSAGRHHWAMQRRYPLHQPRSGELLAGPAQSPHWASIRRKRYGRSE